MSDTKAARRYSEALFRLAAEQGGLDVVAADLRSVLALIRESADLDAFLVNPRVSTTEKASALAALFGSTAHALTLRFLRFLVDRRRLSILAAVCADYEERHLAHHGVRIVSVTSAQALTPAQTDALRARLTARLGGEVRLREQTDPSLLAGFRLRIGDRVEDHTAAAQIRRFHKAVLNA